jgi:hypothetical protein
MKLSFIILTARIIGFPHVLRAGIGAPKATLTRASGLMLISIGARCIDILAMAR